MPSLTTANLFSSLPTLTQPCCSDPLLSPTFHSTLHSHFGKYVTPHFFCSSRLKLLTLHLWSINLLGGQRETYEQELLVSSVCFSCVFGQSEFGSAKLVPHC